MIVNKIKYIFLFMAFLLVIYNLQAQEVNFTGKAPKVVRSGEQFQLVYTLNQEAEEFSPPDFGSFQFLGGPMTGYSSSTQYINGKMTSSTTYTFTYYLQAPSSGKYTIPPATVKIKRTVLQSNSIEVEVVGAGQQNTAATTTNTAAPTTNSSSETGEQTFIRLEVDKTSAYLGEQITAWVKIYTKQQISGIDLSKGPDFTGFYKQDVEIPQLNSLEREKVGDDIYGTGILSKVILYPQRSGDLVISPFELNVEIQQVSKKRPQSIFDEVFGSQYERKRISIKSKPITLHIKPLPDNQTNNFSGAVGKFTINGTIGKQNVKTNDAISLKVTLTGKGNIKLIDKLSTQFPESFESYEPQVNVDANSLGSSGKKVFEYTLIPRFAGDFTIPPIKITYFDPELARYNTVSTQSYDIHVERGIGDTTTVISGNISKEDVQLLGSDIRYIQTNTRFKKLNQQFHGSIAFYFLYLLPLLAFITILLLRRKQIKQNSDVLRYRNRTAGKVAAKRLKNAGKFMKLNQKEAFYDELASSLWGYLADKLAIPMSDLSKENAHETLTRNGVEFEVANEFFELTETCQFARFAPGSKDSEITGLYYRAEKVINRLEQLL